VSDFREEMAASQVQWRRQTLHNQEPGKHTNSEYDYMLPSNAWELNLWYWINSGSPNSLPRYLEENGIRKPNNSHHLLSSWVFCASLYFPFREDKGKQLLTAFLQQVVSPKIEAVSRVEMKFQADADSLKPRNLLGEDGARKGAGITAPDLAFMVDTAYGPGVVMVECTFAETSFRPCYGRVKHAHFRPTNPKPERCLDVGALLDEPGQRCHLQSCDRRYWDHLREAVHEDAFKSLQSCPAAYHGFQLFRLQSLAEGLAQNGHYAMVATVLAYDDRNEDLLTSLSYSTGMENVADEWGKVFSSGKAHFTSFTHQEWVEYVRDHDDENLWTDWLHYVRERYDLLGED
jgi:hypothetical protein